MDPVHSSANGNLDEEIAQLMQCKPLSEQEVQLYFFSCRFHFFMNICFFYVLLGIRFDFIRFVLVGKFEYFSDSLFH